VGEVRSVLRQVRRQLGVQARLDLLVILSSKGQAVVWAVTDLLAYSGGVVAVLLLAQRFDGIAGWSKAELLFLLGYATTVAALQSVFFGYNVSAISRRIGRGQLDHMLIQPRHLLLTLLTEGFSPVLSMAVLIPAVGALTTGAVLSDAPLSAGFFARLLVCLAGSAFIVLAASFAVGAAAFWAPRGAEEISTRANRLVTLTDFPFDPLPRGLRVGLLTVLPAGYVNWFPAGALLGRRGHLDWMVTPLVAVVAVSLSSIIFTKGLRHYERTGSQRYSDFGHRR
jgi:ABC-2 type transport system permease protein